MEFTYIGPEESGYSKLLINLIEKDYSLKKIIKNTLWVEISDNIKEKRSFLDKLREELENNNYKRIRLFCQSPATYTEDPVFIYNVLSYIIKISYIKKLILLSTAITYDTKIDQQLYILSLIDEVISSNQKEPLKEGFYKFEGSLIYWDPQSFTSRCAAEASLKLFDMLREKEERALPENIKHWQNDPIEAFNRLNEIWKDDSLNNLRSLDFSTGCFSFIRTFGTGRRNGYSNIAELINPEFHGNLFELLMSSDDELSDRERVRTIFSYVNLPEPGFLSEIKEIRRIIPTFFYPDIKNLDRPLPLNLETYSPEDTDIPLQTSLWSERINEIIESLDQIMNEAEELLNQIHPAPQERRRITRQVRRELSVALRNLRGQLTNLVDEEIREIINMENLYELSPERFKIAYERFYSDCFSNVLLFFPLIWRLRSFVGIPLSSWVPTIIFPVRSPLREAIRLVIQSLRLLNFYQYMCILLMRYRSYIDEFIHEFRELQRELPGYRKHTENIIKELEKNTGERITHEIDYEKLNISDIKEAPKDFPDITNFIDSYKNELQAKLMRVEQMIVERRENMDITEDKDTLDIFTPLMFHQNEAWFTMVKMIEKIEGEEDFKKTVHHVLNRYQVSIKNLEPYYTIRKTRYALVIEDTNINLWKKRALLNSTCPLRNDILKPGIVDHRSDIEFILERGIESGFLFYDDTDKNLLGFKKEVYNWASQRFRMYFFQSISGLSLEDFNRINKKQEEELKKWYLWVLDKSDNELDIPLENIRATDIIEHILTEYTPPEHFYYGIAEISENNNTFMLYNTYSPALMELFKPKDINDCRPRFFAKEQIYKTLTDERILKETIELFFNYSLVKENNEVIDEFGKRGAFTC